MPGDPRRVDSPSDGPQATSQLAALIQRVATRDSQALASFYDATNRLAFGVILRILGDRDIADEVTLDVYMEVWKRAANFNSGRGTPLAWLLNMARSRAIDRLRSGARRRKHEVAFPDFDTLAKADRGQHPGADAESRELKHQIGTALADLPVEQKEVLELAYFEGLSHAQIAERLEEPLGTVKTRIRLAMNKLRDALEPLEDCA